MSKPQKRYIFCGATGMSREHIWGDWLKKYLAATITKTFTVGQLFVHVLSGSFANHVRDWDWRNWPRAHRVLTQIWPVKESVTVWPIKAASVTDADAYSIARAFFGWVDLIGRAATTGLIIRP